jgi:predicted ATPase
MANNKGLIFHPDLPQFLADREAAYYTTLSGGNNSGKSVLLKNMKIHLGRRAYMAGPQRFYHVYELSTQRWNLQDYDNWDNSFRQNFNQEEANTESNFIDLGRIIGALKDAKRNRLFELCRSLIGSQFALKRREEDNDLSPRYVDMDGQNLSVGSTGTRLLMTLLGLCMDEQFDVMLIDEPELGLSPRVQSDRRYEFRD